MNIPATKIEKSIMDDPYWFAHMIMCTLRILNIKIWSIGDFEKILLEKVAWNGKNSGRTDFMGPKMAPQMCKLKVKHVVPYLGHMYKPFWTMKNWSGWQGGSGKVKIWPRMGLAYVHFWLWSPLETPKWGQDPGNGLKSIRGIWGDHLGSISGVQDPFRGL